MPAKPSVKGVLKLFMESLSSWESWEILSTPKDQRDTALAYVQLFRKLWVPYSQLILWVLNLAALKWLHMVVLFPFLFSLVLLNIFVCLANTVSLPNKKLLYSHWQSFYWREIPCESLEGQGNGLGRAQALPVWWEECLETLSWSYLCVCISWRISKANSEQLSCWSRWKWSHLLLPRVFRAYMRQAHMLLINPMDDLLASLSSDFPPPAPIPSLRYSTQHMKNSTWLTTKNNEAVLVLGTKIKLSQFLDKTEHCVEMNLVLSYFAVWQRFLDFQKGPFAED